jgi:hypothetical protein
MDQQPKPPPVYLKAAEQHRLADRLIRDADAKSAKAMARRDLPKPPPTTAPTPPANPTTKPAQLPMAPSSPFIPPELKVGK